MDGVHIGGFESWIQKSLSQTQGGAEKSSYLLDFDEKEVDYALEPEIMADSSIPPTVKDTVTITDTLPKELRYKPGST